MELFQFYKVRLKQECCRGRQVTAGISILQSSIKTQQQTGGQCLLHISILQSSIKTRHANDGPAGSERISILQSSIKTTPECGT